MRLHRIAACAAASTQQARGSGTARRKADTVSHALQHAAQDWRRPLCAAHGPQGPRTSIGASSAPADVMVYSRLSMRPASPSTSMSAASRPPLLAGWPPRMSARARARSASLLAGPARSAGPSRPRRGHTHARNASRPLPARARSAEGWDAVRTAERNSAAEAGGARACAGHAAMQGETGGPEAARSHTGSR
jgi:hypothetical protein